MEKIYEVKLVGNVTAESSAKAIEEVLKSVLKKKQLRENWDISVMHRKTREAEYINTGNMPTKYAKKL